MRRPRVDFDWALLMTTQGMTATSKAGAHAKQFSEEQLEIQDATEIQIDELNVRACSRSGLPVLLTTDEFKYARTFVRTSKESSHDERVELFDCSRPGSRTWFVRRARRKESLRYYPS
jgi:hypothetical protein